MSFQTTVGVQPAPAVAGDFASANPRIFYAAGPGGLVAGPGGLTVARAAWISPTAIDQDGAANVANNFGSGPITGILHRQQQGLITTFLADSSMSVPPGFPVSLVTGADIWLKNEGATQALVGQFAYANLSTGAFSFGAANSPASASVTGSIAAQTASVTGSIVGNVLTVTAVASGTLVPGATISGGATASGTMIVAQLSGTPGGIGTYALNIPEQSVASGAIAATYGLMTVSAVASGVLGVGAVIAGAGISTTPAPVITALGTGAGGVGTYVVNSNTVISSQTITAATNVQTKFFAISSGKPGEIVKCSSHALG